MIRGARKEMIVVRTGDSRYFDEAYFVLRDSTKKHKQKSVDILNEANRILAETAPEHLPPEKKPNKQWLFFGIGGLLGAVLSVIVTLLLV